ncbi:MAG: hypothetical protein DDT31_01201 [Syntrophomonadaceae bacterium]|nr:hypothetical protein [Bacillota bacterium]MBT9138632.1 hypothetical protein [Bacillota bacterium]
MSKGEIVESNGERLAIYFPASSWERGLTFLTDDRDSVQVGIWGYPSGQKLRPHIHNEIKREVSRTQEVVFVKSGRVATHIFDEEENLVRTIALNPGDILILLGGGHGYEILEDNTCVLEVKNGPYPGAEIDRRRIQWAEKL